MRRRLRERIDAGDEVALAAFLDELEGDSRTGAGQILSSGRKRLERARAERARLARLFEIREGLFEQGARLVAGVDEVGVGPLAGPVVAAAVILPARVDLPRLDDSKKLKSELRERLDGLIREQAIAVGIGEVSPREIDALNIHRASLEAMRRAVVGLSPEPDRLLVDARTIPGIEIPQTPLIHGDARDGSIAAASIVAKVYRDAIMRRLDDRYPGYGFGRHMGYGTAFHVDALSRLGASEVHRRSFSPVAAVSGPPPP